MASIASSVSLKSMVQRAWGTEGQQLMYHLCNVNGCDIYVNMMVGSIVGEEEILLAVLEEYTVQNSQWSTMNFLERWYN